VKNNCFPWPPPGLLGIFFYLPTRAKQETVWGSDIVPANPGDARQKPSIPVILPQKDLQLETLFGGLGGTLSRRRQTLTTDFKFGR
jgi:hypothetical protein